MGKKQRLLSNFQPHTYEDWIKEAKSTLKSKTIDKLFSSTYEGIQIKPLYTEKDIENLKYLRSELPGSQNFLRSPKISGYRIIPWSISQSLPFPDPKVFNQKLKEALQNGVNSIVINHLDTSTHNRSFNGLFLDSVIDFEDAFSGIDLTNFAIHFNSPKIYELSLFFLAYLKRNQIDPGTLSGSFCFDIFKSSLEAGNVPTSDSEMKSKLAQFFELTKNNFPRFFNLVADGTLFFDAGGHSVQEVAFSVASAVEYVRFIAGAGFELDDIFPRFMFKFSIGSNLFIEVAKLRAFRMLWKKVMEEFKIRTENQGVYIYAATNQRNKSKLDIYVNMLRNTGEAFAGILGGSDFIEIKPFTKPFESLPDDFSLQNARNSQNVLLEEHNLREVIDPVGGSWYIESLTFEIASRALELFKSIESDGGFLAWIRESKVQKSIKEVSEKRLNNLFTRKEILVGTNKFPTTQKESIDLPTITELDLDTLSIERKKLILTRRNENTLANLRSRLKLDDFVSIVEFAKNLGCISELPRWDFTSTKEIEKLVRIRETADFEMLRIRAQQYKDKYGNFPKVFLMKFGRVSDYRLRSDFASDFFQVGGFEVIESQGSESVDDLVNGFLISKTQIGVICSSDVLYPSFVPTLANSIKKASPSSILVLAGLPYESALIEKFKASGVSLFIHLKSDIVGTLKEIYNLICPTEQ